MNFDEEMIEEQKAILIAFAKPIKGVRERVRIRTLYNAQNMLEYYERRESSKGAEND